MVDTGVQTDPEPPVQSTALEGILLSNEFINVVNALNASEAAPGSTTNPPHDEHQEQTVATKTGNGNTVYSSNG